MTTLYNETTLNGKYQVMSTEELTGRGIKKVGVNCITENKGNVYKNLNEYWVTKSALDTIKKNFSIERACF